MGMQRYLNVVRTQNQGIVDGGDDTDMEQHAQETAEEEAPVFDCPIEPDDTPELSQVTMTLRNELNDSLRREQWSDAAAFQNCVMRWNQYQPVPADVRRELYFALAADIQILVNRHAEDWRQSVREISTVCEPTQRDGL